MGIPSVELPGSVTGVRGFVFLEVVERGHVLELQVTTGSTRYSIPGTGPYALSAVPTFPVSP